MISLAQLKVFVATKPDFDRIEQVEEAYRLYQHLTPEAEALFIKAYCQAASLHGLSIIGAWTHSGHRIH
jgi:hypothetical protein